MHIYCLVLWWLIAVQKSKKNKNKLKTLLKVKKMLKDLRPNNIVSLKLINKSYINKFNVLE